MAKRKTRKDDSHAVIFEAPNLLHHRPLGASDQSLVASLSEELHRSGVLREDTATAVEADAPFAELLSEATALAKYERELNPDFYHEELEGLPREAEAKGEWDNPSLDGLDDYGHQAYPSALRDRPSPSGSSSKTDASPESFDSI